MNPLATEISRLVDNTKDVTFRIGLTINETTVELHNGVQVQVSKWVGYPGTGAESLVLLLKGTVIGFGLGTTGGAGGGGGAPLIVLGPTDPVPPGTPSGTVIVRTVV